jgi:sulfite reductase alpha subunit-like flavoprotein
MCFCLSLILPQALYEAQIHGKTNTPYVSLLGVLQRFASVAPELGHVLEMLPNMAVRYYSISSSMKVRGGGGGGGGGCC